MTEKIKITTKPCVICSKTSEMELDIDKVRQWRAGSFVQDVWPDMPKDQRELLISGTHSTCWEEMFAEEDED